MAEEQKGRAMLERVLRDICLGNSPGPAATQTERMRAGLILAMLDHNSTTLEQIQSVINGDGSPLAGFGEFEPAT